MIIAFFFHKSPEESTKQFFDGVENRYFMLVLLFGEFIWMISFPFLSLLSNK